MASFSKASQGALRAFKPYLGWSSSLNTNTNTHDERRGSTWTASTSASSNSSEYRLNGWSKTLRHVASMFHVEDDSETEWTHVFFEPSTPKKKGSIVSLRSGSRGKTPLRSTRKFDSPRTLRRSATVNISPSTPDLACGKPIPHLDVYLPGSSLRERTGGLTGESGTKLIDPAEFELEVEDDGKKNELSPSNIEDAGVESPTLRFAIENRPLSNGSEANPFIDPPLSTSTLLQSSAESPKATSSARRFPLRTRLNLKKSLDRLHAKIAGNFTPKATNIEMPSPGNGVDVKYSGNGPLTASMGPRQEWDEKRMERNKRYLEVINDAPPTESDDTSDSESSSELRLHRVHAHSPTEKGKFLNGRFVAHVECKPGASTADLLLSEAIERQCGEGLVSENTSFIEKDDIPGGMSRAYVESQVGVSTTDLLLLSEEIERLNAIDLFSEEVPFEGNWAASYHDPATKALDQQGTVLVEARPDDADAASNNTDFRGRPAERRGSAVRVRLPPYSPRELPFRPHLPEQMASLKETSPLVEHTTTEAAGNKMDSMCKDVETPSKETKTLLGKRKHEVLTDSTYQASDTESVWSGGEYVVEYDVPSVG